MKRLCLIGLVVITSLQAVIPEEYRVAYGSELGPKNDEIIVEKIICDRYNDAESINQDVGALRGFEGIGNMTLLCWMLKLNRYDLANALLTSPAYKINMAVWGKHSEIRNKETNEKDFKERKINALSWVIGIPSKHSDPSSKLTLKDKKNMVEVLLDHGAIRIWDNKSWSDWDTEGHFKKILPEGERDFFEEIKTLIDDYYKGNKKPTYKKLFGDGTIFACKPLEAKVQSFSDPLQLLAQSLKNIKS